MRTWKPAAAKGLATLAGVTALSFGAPVALGGTAGAAALTESATASTKVKVEVKLHKTAKYGKILVDQKAMALYYNKADKPSKHWACTGKCLTIWHALVLPKGQKAAVAEPGVTGLGTVHGPAGKQVTWHGKPLYTFSGDKAGHVKGEGVEGEWFVASLSAKTTTPKNTTTTTSNYGGY